MKISVNKAHFPVTVLGPGRRIGIWVQGCSIGCKNCVSRDTWDRDATRDIEIEVLVDWCKEVSASAFDGITISGGEPFDQPDALALLVDRFSAWRAEAGLGFDILCYSGYPLATLETRHAKLLEKLDAVIAEPYVDRLPMTQPWRGSSNQKLVPLSERGRDLFAPFLDAPLDAEAKRMQVARDGNQIWYIGIPARGDMEQLEKICAARGLAFDQVSWRQ